MKFRNRLTQKTYPDTTAVDYVYDLVGKVLSVNDPTGTYAFAYDNMGRLIGTTTSYSFLTSRNFTNAYTYDAASNRTGFTDPEGGSTTYSYDTLNRLQNLAPPSAFGSGSFGFSYDVLSRRTQMTRPNGVTTNYFYDNLSRLTSILHNLSGSTIDGATYTLDNAGNRLSKTDNRTGITSSYTYDPLYELTQVTQGANTTESYSYDAVGNRTASLGVSSYTTNAGNELTATSNTTYTYDNNGNTLTKTDSTGTATYAWDFENRLSSMTLPSAGGTITFKYDPFGRRIEKSSPTFTSIFAYDGDNLIEETNSSGTVVARYAQGLNIDEPAATLRAGAIGFYEADGLGTITSLTNPAGAPVQTYTFDSFGNQTSSSGSVINPFQYAGREFDSETGLYYNRARYYDPRIGVFISSDPSGLNGGLNAYMYVGGNPTSLIDPTGLDWIEYTGQTLTVWPGKYQDRGHAPVLVCAASSGLPGHQYAFEQNNPDEGPVQENHYWINLNLDPKRWARIVPGNSGELAPGFGVQRIRPVYPLPNGGSATQPGWGTWRARLEPVGGPTTRHNFYVHNSTKGYTHGCIETCDSLYDRFLTYHDEGLPGIDVLVNYTTDSTYGGTAK